ncbi:hypothetical protein DFH11DRAFT_724920 [Phellopilus nigrolimitatus]|nr:hypothetical protein DFH11DRAFT_724920 [Phellopilus nigrolimitatus]
MHVFLWVEPDRYSDICRPAYIVFGSVIITEYIVAEFILYIRAYAVWGRTRAALILLGAPYLIFCSIGFYFAGRFVGSATVSILPLFPSGCLLNLRGDVDRLGMIMLMISETLALGALLVKTSQMPDSTLMKRIFTDGIIYFIIILCASVANLIVLSVASPSLCNFLLVTQCVLHSICCNRLLFRIKDMFAPLEITLPVLSWMPTFANVGDLTNDLELTSRGQ